MTCDDTRARLLELPSADLLALPHLAGCDDCRALAEALVSRHGDLDRALDQRADLPTTLGRPEPANTPWRWTLSSLALAAAVAATLAVGLQAGWAPIPPPEGVGAAAPPDISTPGDRTPSRDEQPPAPDGSVAVRPSPAPEVRPASARPEETAPDPAPLSTRPAPTAANAGAPGPVGCVLTELEPAAIVGGLTAQDVACLEEAFDADPSSSANRLLMVHWFAAGDLHRWEERIRLQVAVDRELDRIDPDLCYKLALHLSKHGDDEEVLRLADDALGRRTVWKGNTYTTRVFSLFKLRAVSRQRLWQQAELQGGDAQTARRETLVAAREWLAFARESGKDGSIARELCLLAAERPEQCD